MCSPEERRWIDFPTDIDESAVDANRINEWDQLAGKEYELELALDRIKDSIHEKYPDLNLALVVKSGILKIDQNTPMHRRASIKRMNELACELIATVDREILNGQRSIKIELNALKKLRADSERKMRVYTMNIHGTNC